MKEPRLLVWIWALTLINLVHTLTLGDTTPTVLRNSVKDREMALSEECAGDSHDNSGNGANVTSGIPSCVDVPTPRPTAAPTSLHSSPMNTTISEPPTSSVDQSRTLSVSSSLPLLVPTKHITITIPTVLLTKHNPIVTVTPPPGPISDGPISIPTPTLALLPTVGDIPVITTLPQTHIPLTITTPISVGTGASSAASAMSTGSTDVTLSNTHFPLWPIVAGTLGGIIAVISIMTLIVWTRRRKREAPKGEKGDNLLQ